jgi:hypothetical protein
MASTMQILMNPAKMVLGKGTAIKLSGTPKSLVHIKSSKGNFALCGAGHPSNYKSKKNRRKIVKLGGKKPVVTCYRCIKLFRMGPKVGKKPGTGLLAQKLKFPGNKQEHYLIPGGRQGGKVSGTKKYTRKVRAERFEEGFGPFTLKGTFRGPQSHPTQSRMLPSRTKSARKRATQKPIAARKASKQISLLANPHYFGMGYSKGTKDYRSAVPTPASTLKKRGMSYQRGYLEGYADAADKKTVRANPKKRKNPNPIGKAQKAIMAYLKGSGSDGADLGDLGRIRGLRGVHFAQIMSSVEALEKKGLIRVKGTMIFPTTRKNTRTKSNPKTKRVSTQHGYRYMVNGKFATKRKYDAAKKRR